MGMDPREEYRWVILGLASFCMLTIAIVLQSIPPILGIIVDVFGVSYARAGALMGLIIFPSILLSLPGGVLVDRFGIGKMGVAALVILGSGTALVALAETYWVMALGRLVAGIGYVVMLVVIPNVITSWFHGREIGLSMGVFNTAFPLGTILSLNFMGVIAYRFNWHASIWVTVVLVAVTLCLFILFCRTKEREGALDSRGIKLWSVVKEAGWRIWCVGISWGLFNAGIISFFTYSPDYFVSQGRDIANAGLLASYPMWGSIILAPFFGSIIDRMGRKWLFVAAGSLGIAILIYAIPNFSENAALICIAIGIFVALFTPAIFSLPSDLLPGKVMGFGFGIMGTTSGMGIFFGPYLVGSLRDITGNYTWSFAAMAIFSGAAMIPMFILRAKKRNKGRRKTGAVSQGP
jgi:MFS family permease